MFHRAAPRRSHIDERPILRQPGDPPDQSAHRDAVDSRRSTVVHPYCRAQFRHVQRTGSRSSARPDDRPRDRKTPGNADESDSRQHGRGGWRAGRGAGGRSTRPRTCPGACRQPQLRPTDRHRRQPGTVGHGRPAAHQAPVGGRRPAQDQRSVPHPVDGTRAKAFNTFLRKNQYQLKPEQLPVISRVTDTGTTLTSLNPESGGQA
jgi:hypothetical protein